MNCLKDEFIQLFIDGELVGEDLARFESHMVTCEKCTERVSEHRDFALQTREAIKSLDYDLSEIPGFGLRQKKKGTSNGGIYKVLYPIAAACIITLFLVLPINKDVEESEEIIVLSSFSGGIDANLPLSEQEFDIVFYNENGEIWNE